MSHKIGPKLSQGIAKLPFTFLPMTVTDLPSVMEIEAQAYSYPWPEAAFRQELLNAQAQFVVLRHQAQIVGYSGQWYFVDQAHIGTIASHPLMRGRGLGDLLLINLIEAALEFPVETITLEVRPSNHVAQNLYRKYGFAIVGRRKNYYPNTGEDALIMTTPLLTSEKFQQRFYELASLCFNKLQQSNLDELDWLT